MERPVKFILQGHEIRMSHALYHRDLLKRDEYTCDGGGIVTIDNDAKTVTFSGESDDFGKCDDLQFELAVEMDRQNIDNSLYFMFSVETEDYEIIFK